MDSGAMMHSDLDLVDKILSELKSQGLFDKLRKECMADVDTKPAHQNLRQKVETSVSEFLIEKEWKPELSKNQLRDSIKKYLINDHIESGVDRILNQVINSKVYTAVVPYVEDVMYSTFGIEKPATENCSKDELHEVAQITEESEKKSHLSDLLAKDSDNLSSKFDELKDISDVKEKSTESGDTENKKNKPVSKEENVSLIKEEQKGEEVKTSVEKECEEKSQDINPANKNEVTKNNNAPRAQPTKFQVSEQDYFDFLGPKDTSEMTDFTYKYLKSVRPPSKTLYGQKAIKKGEEKKDDKKTDDRRKNEDKKKSEKSDKNKRERDKKKSDHHRTSESSKGKDSKDKSKSQSSSDGKQYSSSSSNHEKKSNSSKDLHEKSSGSDTKHHSSSSKSTSHQSSRHTKSKSIPLNKHHGETKSKSVKDTSKEDKTSKHKGDDQSKKGIYSDNKKGHKDKHRSSEKERSSSRSNSSHQQERKDCKSNDKGKDDSNTTSTNTSAQESTHHKSHAHHDKTESKHEKTESKQSKKKYENSDKSSEKGEKDHKKSERTKHDSNKVVESDLTLNINSDNATVLSENVNIDDPKFQLHNLKKPKIADNMYQIRKIMKLRKTYERLEKDQLKKSLESNKAKSSDESSKKISKEDEEEDVDNKVAQQHKVDSEELLLEAEPRLKEEVSKDTVGEEDLSMEYESDVNTTSKELNLPPVGHTCQDESSSEESIEQIMEHEPAVQALSEPPLDQGPQKESFSKMLIRKPIEYEPKEKPHVKEMIETEYCLIDDPDVKVKVLSIRNVEESEVKYFSLSSPPDFKKILDVMNQVEDNSDYCSSPGTLSTDMSNDSVILDLSDEEYRAFATCYPEWLQSDDTAATTFPMNSENVELLIAQESASVINTKSTICLEEENVPATSTVDKKLPLKKKIPRILKKRKYEEMDTEKPCTPLPLTAVMDMNEKDNTALVPVQVLDNLGPTKKQDLHINTDTSSIPKDDDEPMFTAKFTKTGVIISKQQPIVKGQGKRVQEGRRGVGKQQQQRYDNSDLYKPRLSFTPSRRMRESAAATTNSARGDPTKK